MSSVKANVLKSPLLNLIFKRLVSTSRYRRAAFLLIFSNPYPALLSGLILVCDLDKNCALRQSLSEYPAILLTDNVPVMESPLLLTFSFILLFTNGDPIDHSVWRCRDLFTFLSGYDSNYTLISSNFIYFYRHYGIRASTKWYSANGRGRFKSGVEGYSCSSIGIASCSPNS